MKFVNLSVSASILLFASVANAPVGAQELNERQMEILREREEAGVDIGVYEEQYRQQLQAEERKAQQMQPGQMEPGQMDPGQMEDQGGVPENPDHRYSGEYSFSPYGRLTPQGEGFDSEFLQSVFNLTPRGFDQNGQPRPLVESVNSLGFVGEGKAVVQGRAQFNIDRLTPSGVSRFGGRIDSDSTLRSTSPNGEVWSSDIVEIPELEDFTLPSLIPGDITHDVSAGAILRGPGEVSGSASGSFDFYLDRGRRD